MNLEYRYQIKTFPVGKAVYREAVDPDAMKISLAYVSAMFVVVRILNAIITPAFGVFCYRQKSRWGRYRP